MRHIGTHSSSPFPPSPPPPPPLPPPPSPPFTLQLLMVPTPFFIGVHSSFLDKIGATSHPEAWMINLDTKQFEQPTLADQQTIPEFPYCILQLQADIRKVGGVSLSPPLHYRPRGGRRYSTACSLSARQPGGRVLVTPTKASQPSLPFFPTHPHTHPSWPGRYWTTWREKAE